MRPLSVQRTEKQRQDRDYYLRNRERIKARTRQYAIQNAERTAEYLRAYRAANADKRRIWRETHREREAARDRAWYDKNAERKKAYAKAWRRNNTERRSAQQVLRAARVLGAAGKATPEQIEARRAFYGHRCCYCGGAADTIDHVIPIVRGGSNWPANLRPACRSCNSAKRDLPLRVFLERK